MGEYNYTNKKAQELFRESKDLYKKAAEVKDEDEGLAELLRIKAECLREQADNIENRIIDAEDYGRD